MDKQLPERSLLRGVFLTQNRKLMKVEEQERNRVDIGVYSLIHFMPVLLLQELCSLGGRRSMAAQRTHRELAPSYAAGKVPVPSGRECHWETRRPLPCSLQRSSRGVVVAGFGPLQQQSHAMSVCTPTERGSLSPCSPFAYEFKQLSIPVCLARGRQS